MVETVPDRPQEILRMYWGYPDFRPKQREIIDSAVNGNDVLAILPTGGGKSVCFQVPTLMKEGVSIVITPLIALMKDQVANLNSRGIKSLAIYSGMSAKEIDTALDNAVYGDFKFLYLSPERLRTEIFITRLQYMKIAYIVVDEAHCISQWGYDFRPDYLEISKIREITGRKVPVIALTATATPEVASDIMQKLEFRRPNLIKGSFERENLSYVVRKCEDKLGQLLSVCKGVPGTGIVYVRMRSRAEEIAAFLVANGYVAEAYHAGMGKEAREGIQERWKSGKTRIIVSTNAFGMGIDKPDVRFVCHFDMPDSIEAYFQEAGRGGRDGKRSYAVLLWNDSDVRRLRQIKENSFPSLDYIEDVYHKVHNYFGIPFGYGEGHVGKFNINDFCSRYKLPRSKVASSVKYIEMENHWEVEAEGEIPTRVGFSVSREELYSFNPGNALEENVVDFLMRRYPGIFSQTVTIDTGYAARLVECSENEFKKCLYGLYKKGIIIYIPSDKTPLIRFKENRLMPKDVYLPKSRYDDRLRRFSERLESIISYVSRTDECRSVLLLGYFGEKAARKCGKCDVCLAKSAGKSSRRKEMAVEIAEFVSKYDFSGICRKYSIDTRGEWLISAVSTNEFLKDVVAAFGDGYKDYISVLRRMLDSGALGNIRNP